MFTPLKPWAMGSIVTSFKSKHRAPEATYPCLRANMPLQFVSRGYVGENHLQTPCTLAPWNQSCHPPQVLMVLPFWFRVFRICFIRGNTKQFLDLHRQLPYGGRNVPHLGRRLILKSQVFLKSQVILKSQLSDLFELGHDPKLIGPSASDLDAPRIQISKLEANGKGQLGGRFNGSHTKQ